MEQRIERIEKQLEKIMDNDLVHLKSDVSEVKTGLGIISTNVSWLMKYHWTTMTAAIGSFVSAVIGLILK